MLITFEFFFPFNFREALALAKAQLPADDPFITGAVLKASNFFSQYHEYEYEAEW